MHTPPPDEFFLAWIRGWALTREVAPPVAHADGFHIAVGLPKQAARYVFPSPSPAIADLGGSITQPWVYIKACASSEQLRALLPDRWRIDDLHYLMNCDATPFPHGGELPAGYRMEVEDAMAGAGRGHVRVVAPDGTLAAAGHVALGERLATYDRIVTEPAHQRRGLGRAVMCRLQALARAHGRSEGVLVATEQGRALYEALGWRLHSPWAGAVIPGPDTDA
ncbi:GNAT family N-acetyltransferase [Scleromatobacter humisilvae]|uniref:GNAT family N-acetyltransferase n=1 Tax=Scleromatobacter humisilvae TaxID=2897159 RepID=A0A9X1YRD3_9BURK|nr:GNAT family N-acetyltransferase [Scleromatobacter humisilvae]MCK9687171.1 GNAT family N-acetyltransferase [Scleromatobacter humisilvae]